MSERDPIRCAECTSPAAYHVHGEGGRDYIEIISRHHGTHHVTRIPVANMAASKVDKPSALTHS